MQSKVKLRKLCAQCKAIFCHLSTLRSNFIVYRDTWYINTDTYDMVCFAVLCDSERPPHLPSPLSALSLLCRLFPLRRRDDLFGQIVQLALLLFRCISCNYWPNGANRLQIAFRESCHSRISTYYTGRKISGESCRQHQQRQQQGATSCGAQLSVLSWRLAVWSSSNNNYRKLTSFHQQQERSFPELPAG